MPNVTVPRPPSFPSLVQTVLHRVSGHAACLEPPNHRFLSRRLDAVLGLRTPATAQGAHGAAPGRYRARPDPGVPGPPGAAAAQHGAQPQPETDGATCVPQVRGAARRVVVARHRAGAGRADEALRASDARLPVARGDAGGAGRAGQQLDVAARPSAVGHALQHRGSGLGDHRRAGGRCGARPSSVRPSSRQGP